MKNKKVLMILKKAGVSVIIIFLCGLFLLPVCVLLSGSVADKYEWGERIKPMLAQEGGFITWRLIPDYPTGENYIRLLFYSPGFMKLFWNSVSMVFLILAGQLLVGVPAAWAFASFRFRAGRVLFQVYVILMLMPFQVTMLSRYLVLSKMQLLGTRWAVVLPAVFSTFPVFLTYRSFSGIPAELLEAARIDGAGEGKIFIKIGVPLAKGGILACLVLSFLECWNMMEEPLAFLQDVSKWPLSLYLPEIGLEQAGYAACASVVTLAVSLFVFAIFHDSLEQGIAASGIKG